MPLDADYKPGKLHVIADGLKMPVGVAWRDGSLYVSAIDRIVRLDDIDRQLESPPKPAVVRAGLPSETTTAGNSSHSARMAGSTCRSAHRATSVSLSRTATPPSCACAGMAANCRLSPAACATRWV